MERNLNGLVVRLQLDEVAALFDEMHQINWLLMQFVPAGLDARQVQDFVDQIEKVLAAGVNIACILLVVGVFERAEHLVFHHFGEAEDSVERCPQFMTHGGEEA